MERGEMFIQVKEGKILNQGLKIKRSYKQKIKERKILFPVEIEEEKKALWI